MRAMMVMPYHRVAILRYSTPTPKDARQNLPVISLLNLTRERARARKRARSRTS
jgi:hypothetical protein